MIKVNKTLTAFYSASFASTFSCENYSYLLEKDMQTQKKCTQTFIMIRLKSCHFFFN